MRLTKVTVPFASTDTSGGVRSLISTVAVGAALAPGTRTNAPATTAGQASSRATVPLVAVRRIRPVAMLALPPVRRGGPDPLLAGNHRLDVQRGCSSAVTAKPRRCQPVRSAAVAVHPIGVHVGAGPTADELAAGGPAARAAQLDADGVQIFLTDPQSYTTPTPRPDAEALRGSGLMVVVHAPYMLN